VAKNIRNLAIQMPHILIVAATPYEVQPLLEKYSIILTGDGLVESYVSDTRMLSVLITGVGMVNTAYQLGRNSHTIYDAIINVGICGAFDRHLKLGQVVNVTKDELCEMGAEDGDEFIKYKDLELSGTSMYDNKWIMRSKEIAELKTVKGITVNKVHGNEESIERVKKLFSPEVESMEGAAFFAACKGVSNYTQIRAVSNYVEKRDKSKWEIKLAVSNLNAKVLNILTELFERY
jgi:futalosine hydrolase